MEGTTTLAPAKAQGIRISFNAPGLGEIGHVYLYVMENDAHTRPFALMEDLKVVDQYHSQGVGSALIDELIRHAKSMNCYKLIATSRHTREYVHAMYLKRGFRHHGNEFRMDFE